MSQEYHVPVMLAEVMGCLRVREGGRYIDCTLGGGGYSLEILRQGGIVTGVDRDPEAIAYASDRLREFGDRFVPVESVFSRITDIAGIHAGEIDGIVMDLGVSSRMIDDPARGFSYRHEGPLLMTMGDAEETAFDVINTKDAKELAFIFRTYGEERNASRIARAVVGARSSGPIASTTELADIIEKSVGSRLPQKSKGRVFQALRIFVNREIEELGEGLEGSVRVLKPGGRLCVVSYHSIEDRTVKRFMREKADPCICPSDFPECTCGRRPSLKLVSRKAVKPTDAEKAVNTRAHSALLRVAERLAPENETGGS